MVTWKTFLLQDSASSIMEQLTFFHDYALVILIIITILVGQMLVSMVFNKFINRYLLEGQLIEVIWTVLQAVILILPFLQSVFFMS